MYNDVLVEWSQVLNNITATITLNLTPERLYNARKKWKKSAFNDTKKNV